MTHVIYLQKPYNPFNLFSFPTFLFYKISPHCWNGKIQSFIEAFALLFFKLLINFFKEFYRRSQKGYYSQDCINLFLFHGTNTSKFQSALYFSVPPQRVIYMPNEIYITDLFIRKKHFQNHLLAICHFLTH